MSKHAAISPDEAADRLAIRELVDAYAFCADRRDVVAGHDGSEQVGGSPGLRDEPFDRGVEQRAVIRKQVREDFSRRVVSAPHPLRHVGEAERNVESGLIVGCVGEVMANARRSQVHACPH